MLQIDKTIKNEVMKSESATTAVLSGSPGSALNL
jgi:hypothetical protein